MLTLVHKCSKHNLKSVFCKLISAHGSGLPIPSISVGLPLLPTCCFGNPADIKVVGNPGSPDLDITISTIAQQSWLFQLNIWV